MKTAVVTPMLGALRPGFAAVGEAGLLAPAPFVREAGRGPGVVCIHANASSSSQWRPLMDRLADRYHVLAADSFGAGRSPAWPADRVVSLRGEVELLEPVLARAGEAPTLVGHSYGAAVALMAALLQPRRFRRLVLYEPTLFTLLDQESPPPNDADGVRAVIAAAMVDLARGDRNAAAERFVDYWAGEGTWRRMPEARRGPITASIGDIDGWGRALFDESIALSAFGALTMPVLLMVGRRSPASSRGVARLLSVVLPNVERIEFDGLGHMGPVTHPDTVDPVIQSFLERP